MATIELEPFISDNNTNRMHAITPIIGAVNNEQKALIAIAVQDDWARPNDIHDRLTYAGVDPGAITKLNIAQSLSRLSEKGFLERAGDSVFDTEYKTTELFELSKAVAGPMLRVCIEADTPVKFITGEESQKRHKNGTITDAIEKRIMVWRSIIERTHDGWFGVKEIIQELESFGVKENATRNCLEELALRCILEKRITKNGRYRRSSYRWHQGTLHRTEPSVKTYLEIVNMINEQDQSEIETASNIALKTAREIRGAKMGQKLIKRSQRTTPKHPSFQPSLTMMDQL